MMILDWYVSTAVEANLIRGGGAGLPIADFYSL